MKNILYILPMNKLSGAEKMTLLICNNLKKHKPIVVCGGETLAEVFRKNNIKTYVLNFSNKKIFTLLHGLKDIIKSNDIKIVHAHDNSASINSYLVKKIYRLDFKVISHIHSCYPWLKKNGINKKIDMIFRPKYDFNIACGKFAYDFYFQNTSYFNKDKTKVLSNAIDINEIEKMNINKSELVRERFNIPKNKIIIGFIGRLENMKGLIPFINEFRYHKKKFLNCKVLLVGSGTLEADIKKIIKDNGLENLFILTGFQNNIYDFYPLIDVFFLPSLYEGLPMVILEAMAFKCPIVSTNVGSISEVIDHEKSGFIIENLDFRDFIEKLYLLSNDKKLRGIFSINAFKTISELYDIKKYNKTLEDLYLEV